MALDAYSQNLPSLLGLSGNLNNFSTTQAGFPDILNKANTAQEGLLQTATGGPDSGPFATLKQNLLGNYDTGTTATNKALTEQEIANGTYGSAAGMGALSGAMNQEAQQRALLGSQQDVNALNMEQNTINSSASLGTTIANLLQQLGITNPMAAIAQSQQQPTFQDIKTEPYTPTSGLSGLMQMLGQGLVAPTLSGGNPIQQATTGGVNGLSQMLGLGGATAAPGTAPGMASFQPTQLQSNQQLLQNMPELLKLLQAA